VKTLALLIVSLVLLASSTLGSAATLRQQHSALGRARTVGALFHQLRGIRFGGIRDLVTRPLVAPAQAAATPTATPTATTTATSTYPDPRVILQNMVTVLEQVASAHFDDTIDGNQINTEVLHIDIPGDATCTGPAMKGQVTGSDTLEGTSQKTTYKASFIWINKKAWVKSKATHQKWAKSKATITPFQGFTLNFQTDIFPLPCGGTALAVLSRPQQTTPQIKDLVNLGPDTFQGIPVWHIRFVIPQTDTSGQTYDVQYDLLISQDHYLPYVQTVTIALDPQTTLINKSVMTKFGNKVTVKKPKIGSTKP
jgi:hypothetical protein